MANRWLRVGIAVLALVAAVAAAYRISQQDARLSHDLSAARAANASAEAALLNIAELKAALYAYVAEGQGAAFWTARASSLIDSLRSALLELDAPATAAGTSMTSALDLTDRLAALEERARAHVSNDQDLLAGEVIFVEARDLLDAARQHVARVRADVAAQSAAAQAALRREQAWLGLGAAGVLAFAMLLLVLPGRQPAPAASSSEAASQEPDEFDSSARLVSRVPLGSDGRPLEAASTAPKTQTSGTLVGAGTLRRAAEVCTDLGRIAESADITSLLARSAAVLDASSVVIWMRAADGQALHPVASAGLDDRVLARIGALARDADNVTASAFRDAAPRTAARMGPSAAALAVPLLTPSGVAGVLSAELRDGKDADEARVALAVIFGAQLATLVGSMAASDAPQPSVSAQA